MLPIDVSDFGKTIGYSVFLLIGMGFGASLELAGFGDSRKLAGQFYFRDMTVLKTMFTGILTACILIFLSSAVGWLDFSQISVNQTYLWPGILGGLVMGVGFVIGGYCPGTSVVAAASFKVDGLAFVTGTVVGVGVFGETVSRYYHFWNSSFVERYLLSDWLGWSVGATVVGVTVLALVMFYGAEKTENYYRSRVSGEKFNWKLADRRLIAGGSVFLVLALITWGIGQPSAPRRWELMHSRYESSLQTREVFVHPLEYIKTWHDSSVKLITLDLRGKEDFERFHLEGAIHSQLTDLLDAKVVAPLAALPSQGVVVLVSDDESTAIQAWQWLKVQGVVNLYILENGLKSWSQTFRGLDLGHEVLNLSRPPLQVLEKFSKDAFTPKIKLKTNKRSGGLCS